MRRELPLHVLLAVGGLIVLMPYLWMVTTSLKPLRLTFSPPYLFPADFEWVNYGAAWDAAPFARYYLNSAIMAVTISVGQMVTGAMAAYAFDRLDFPFKNVLFFAFLGTLMIPLNLILIPSYLLVLRLGWLNT